MNAIAPHIAARLESGGAACMDRRIADLSSAYSRGRDLRTLYTPGDILDGAPEGIVRWLTRALRAERAKALGGHWSYSANRHMLLHAALKSERGLLAQKKPPQAKPAAANVEAVEIR